MLSSVRQPDSTETSIPHSPSSPLGGGARGKLHTDVSTRHRRAQSLCCSYSESLPEHAQARSRIGLFPCRPCQRKFTAYKTQQPILIRMTSTFATAMFASVDGANSGYMAVTPHIPAPRQVFVPTIPGNNLLTRPKAPSNRQSSAEVQDRMDRCFPESMAKSPSTLR